MITIFRRGIQTGDIFSIRHPPEDPGHRGVVSGHEKDGHVGQSIGVERGPHVLRPFPASRGLRI